MEHNKEYIEKIISDRRRLIQENAKITIENKELKEQLRIGGVGGSMVKLCGNTTNKDYADFTDQIIVVIKNGQTIVLEPEDLKKLEQAVGGKFRR